MNLVLGDLGVLVAFVASLFGILTLATGLFEDRPAVRRTARWYAWFVLGGMLLAFLAMERALITRDFDVDYVAQVGSHRTPALYNVAALWSSLEGSILLWSLVLSGYLVATVVKFRTRLEDRLVSWALLTIFAVSAFFTFLMLRAADPFQESVLPPGFTDGPGPNPLLQNHPLMVIHPPMLYLGYVGFTVPFAFAIAALVTGRVGEGWLVATRRWTLIAWGFLTGGIVLGAWWSYEVLGWGGYWAWDPVENASFLPWLTGTAFIHSVMVQERRGMLRVWNLALVCATFALTILGTFLTRSGVLDSVHAFSDSLIGPLLLGFFGVVVAVTCGLIAWRGEELRSPGRIDAAVSREGSFLVNNLLFAAFAFVVLLGTVFPLVVEAVSGDRITVGEPFFDTMAMPLGLALLFLMAVAPVLPWRKASTETLATRLHWPAWIGAGCLALAVLLGARGLAPLLAFGLGGFAAGAALRQVVLATRRQGWRGLVGRANGGMIVHLGVVLIGVALAASQSYATQLDVTLRVGESAEVAGHTVELVGTSREDTDRAEVGKAQVRIDGGRIYEPAISQFPNAGQAIGTPSVRTGLTRDVYLSLGPGTDLDAGVVALRVIVQPLIVWLWVGGLLMFVGTFLAAFPGRRRDPLDPVSAPVDAPAVVAADPEPAGAVVSSWDAEVEAPGTDPEGDHEGDDAGGGGSRRVGVIVTVVVVLLAMGLLIVVLATREPAANRIAESPLVGRTAPAVVGTTLDDTTFDLADESGSWVLVNFFATWCAPCRREHDDLVAFHERHAAVGDASVVSVVFGDDPGDARDFFEENGAPFPVITSDEGDIALDYGVAKVPESYLVSPDGVIVAKIIGGVTAEGLEELLARFAPA